MRTLLIPVSLSLFLLSCSGPKTENTEDCATDSLQAATLAAVQERDTTATPVPEGSFSLQVYENQGSDGLSGFGYDILKDGQAMIHQPHIPAISGMKGFATREDAEKAGGLMLMKIQKGIMPPTLSIREMDSLHIVQ
ncbi:MAG: DUF4907 domain-containing protein [Bacteroidia bacterium]|nr:DUF4907 domain-containing protein [Bacteroidia bacterium]